MHPILEDRRRLALYLLAWLLIGLLLSVGLRSDAEWTTAAAFLLPLCFVYAFIGLSTWYLCRAFPIGGRSSWSTLIAVQSIAAAAASAIWTALGYVWASALDALGGNLGAQPFYAQQRPLLFVVGALLYWLAAACHYLLVAFQSSRDADTRAFEQTLLAREAELRALRAQIDPHFIFNSLHSISALTATDAAAARTMCLLLADFLRDTLRLGSSSRISFADEWSLAERFLAIEQVRLGSRLTIAHESDPHAAGCPVPPLLLQPLVENAVIHGIAQLVEGGTIRMTAHREGPTLTVTVENPCDPDRLRTRGVGLGLEVLRKRLTTEFGVYDAVRAEERAGRFKVEVRIPVVGPYAS
jgi:two-component system, LytTR family, sensor histidine kinase AlgZ